jgi:hypothetical protein
MKYMRWSRWDLDHALPEDFQAVLEIMQEEIDAHERH